MANIIFYLLPLLQAVETGLQKVSQHFFENQKIISGIESDGKKGSRIRCRRLRLRLVKCCHIRMEIGPALCCFLIFSHTVSLLWFCLLSQQLMETCKLVSSSQ